jgi:hypothetical protein
MYHNPRLNLGVQGGYGRKKAANIPANCANGVGVGYGPGGDGCGSGRGGCGDGDGGRGDGGGVDWKRHRPPTPIVTSFCLKRNPLVLAGIGPTK